MPDFSALTVAVNCPGGQTIGAALNQTPGRPITINVTGPCNENVTISRDDVTLQGTAPNTLITATNNTASTITINGARRIVLDSFDVRGGTNGVQGLRGASFDLRNCSARNNSSRGVSVSNQSTGTVDNCLLEANQDGALAANGANLYITNSTIQNNTADGVIAVRNSHVRIGQDINGTTVVRPVTITGNPSNGVVITDASVGMIVGGVIESINSTSSLVFVGRSSHVKIGLGSNNLQAATTVRNTQSDAIVLSEAASGVIVNTTVTGATNGITVRNGASARIGIDENNALAGNTITANRRVGVFLDSGASAEIGGNVISANGTDASGSRYGLQVNGSSALLAGGNTIENNPWSGIVGFRGSNIIVGAGFGAIPTANTIRGNGIDGLANGTAGGILLAFQAVADIRDATITANHGYGIRAFENSVAEVRNTIVTGTLSQVPGDPNNSHGGAGATAAIRSTVRLGTGGDVSNNAGHGIQLFSGSALNFRGDVVTTVNGNGGFGIQCTGTEASFEGNTTGVGPNTSGAISAACTGF